jgi:hypothetical protein
MPRAAFPLLPVIAKGELLVTDMAIAGRSLVDAPELLVVSCMLPSPFVVGSRQLVVLGPLSAGAGGMESRPVALPRLSDH